MSSDYRWGTFKEKRANQPERMNAFHLVFPDGTQAVCTAGVVTHVFVTGEKPSPGPPAPTHSVWDMRGDTDEPLRT